ncbi:MAG: VOC family protein [Planctomycetota bacterium]|nr:VOC family protein [Planctomycetota bacterium]MDA1177496.1 VOC family protein [Planctomycetota bacterium]
MSVAHLAIGARDVQATARFLCQTMRWQSIAIPTNVPREVEWIDISPQKDRSQQIHIIHVEGFSASPFESEFGRHLAVFHDGDDMTALRQRITAQGGELIEPLRSTPFERFFFREPNNGYVFEVINRDQWKDGS